MPSGAKKRKAAKKKLQKEAHNTIQSNGTHSNGNEYHKSHDERESDGGEFERESSEEHVVNNNELGNKEISKEVKKEESFDDVSVDADDVERKSQNEDASGEHRSSSSSSSDDDEVVVEKDHPVKAADFMPEEASLEDSVTSEIVCNSIEESIPVKESVKQVVSLQEESNLVTESLPVENSTTCNVVDTGLKRNADEVLPSPDEKDKACSVVTGLQQEKTEANVTSLVDEGSINPSEPVIVTARDEEALLLRSSGVTGVDASCKDDHDKELPKNKYSEEQPFVSSAPIPVRRTSWMNCCGLFEVLSGGSGR